jgi:hypothetical protein
MLGQFALALEKLGWDTDDELSVEIGGVAVTGTATHPDVNAKWAKPFGTVTYQNDSFIVIKKLKVLWFSHNLIQNLNNNIHIKEKTNEQTVY